MPKDKIVGLISSFEDELARTTAKTLEQVRTKYLGRKSALNVILKSLSSLKPEERKTIGAEANKAKALMEQAVLAREKTLNKTVDEEKIDITAPGKKYPSGHIHPVSQVLDEMVEIFTSLGYEVADGPEVEDDWHNFEALNMGPEHPARDMQDTFYLTNGTLPRTHTSPVQIRYMEEHKPPLKIISIGKVHRNENEDATHSWIFHQVEGLVVGEGVTFADLKGTLDLVAKKILGPDTKTRFRPSFFPYTEPSAELDASCPQCKGEGCRSCGGSGWLELLGSGMVHPQVLRNMNIDPEKYSGFAFGLGVERIAMIRHNIPDVRYFWHPDVRFLEQF
jgi:phenylalanyl-tRNA synthetase alpha chain